MSVSTYDILSQFATKGKPGRVEPYGAGHIHDTYRAENGDTNHSGYVLQRICHRIFGQIPQLMKNIGRLTAHLRRKLQTVPGAQPDRETLTVVPAHNGKLFYRDSEGNYWRVYRFIAAVKSYDLVEAPDQAYQGGKAFGKFGAFLADLPAAHFHETLPGFHYIEKRLNTFSAVLAADKAGRAAGVAAEIAFVRERAEEMGTILRWGREGKLPLRIAHNDTKFNNVLLDERDQALYVVDLDTVMPGYVTYDFGDSIRTTNTAVEDEADLAKIDFDLELFEAYTRGYLEEMGPVLTPQELHSLPLGCKLMPYIMGVSFLTDYLDGDKYYKIHLPGHNLQRSRAQFAYLRRIEAQYARLGASSTLFPHQPIYLETH
jgi:Ser/Thr protein kinase RdoA (MazF antagonist)